MRYRAYLALPIVLGLATIIALPTMGQEQKGAAPQSPTKRAKGDPPQKLEPPKAGDNRAMELRKKLDGPRAGDPVWDFWYPTLGGFHLEGQNGRGIYRWPGPVVINRDDPLTFVDDFPLGADEGWTYRVVGTNLHFFFSRSPTAYCGNRWQISASYGGELFFPFSCAD